MNAKTQPAKVSAPPRGQGHNDGAKDIPKPICVLSQLPTIADYGLSWFRPIKSKGMPTHK